MMTDLFPTLGPYPIATGAMVLPGFALAEGPALFDAVMKIDRQAPFRCMTTPGGFPMSVAMTNCGTYGWVSDVGGYRYDPRDPVSGLPWPALPADFLRLATSAAALAGHAAFTPDVCLINRYQARTRLSLHQDSDERDFTQPIVSVSLGLPATFLFGGARRRDTCLRIPLAHGDVVVWGGEARRHYHGVAPLAAGEHPLTGQLRINLTFRRAR